MGIVALIRGEDYDFRGEFLGKVETNFIVLIWYLEQFVKRGNCSKGALFSISRVKPPKF